MTNPVVYMLIGLPYSGKTTYVLNDKDLKDLHRISSDDIIHRMASEHGLTYNEGFSRFVDAASREMMSDLEDVYSKKLNFVFDRTNLTKKSRARFIKQFISHGYDVVAVYFNCNALDQDEIERRRNERTNQVINSELYDSMKSRLQEPDLSEGFIRVEVID